MNIKKLNKISVVCCAFSALFAVSVVSFHGDISLLAFPLALVFSAVLAFASLKKLFKENNLCFISVFRELLQYAPYVMLISFVLRRAGKTDTSFALDFISDRPNDNIGLTIFAGEAFTQCPPTTDHTSLINILRSVRTDLTTNGLIEDGTAVGMGLSNAVSRLKDSKTKSKVVILLTDGSNNRGDISPMTAAEIAQNFGIRVYTIGFGTNGITRYPIQINGTTQYINARGDIDYKTLQDIAVSTNGNFYRATSKAELQKIYEDIDKLEKTKLMSRSYAQRYEAYAPFVVAALILLLIEIILRISVLRRIP